MAGLGTVVFDILAITQCQPISFAWNGWDKLHKGHCVGVGEVTLASALLSITLDLWMLAIPLSQVVRLQMKWKRKLAVALMFALGTL